MYWKYFKNIIVVLGGMASIVTIIAFVWSIHLNQEKKIKVECHTERMLSFGTKVDSLTVLYKGIKIDDVWKIRIDLNNIGMQSIIGCGSSSAFLNDRLIINIDNNFQIISYSVNKNDFGAKYNQLDNSFAISFKKWKPNEKLQMEVLLSPIKNKEYPLVSINERDIIGADVVFRNLDLAKIEDSSNNLDWLNNLKLNFPSFLFKIAKYVGLFFFSVFCIAPIYYIFDYIKGRLQYSRWKKKNWKRFLKELENSQIPINERQQYKYKPYDVPQEYYLQFTNIPKSPDSFGMLIWMIVFSVLVFCPFVVYAFFAWYNL